jgi:hypothetical protein
MFGLFEKKPVGTLVEEVESKPILKCTIHGKLRDGDKDCSQCDVCQHGVSRNGHCEGCCQELGNDWATKEISKDEFKNLLRYFGSKGSHWGEGPWRHPDYLRNYTVTSVLQVLLKEYAIQRGWSEIII